MGFIAWLVAIFQQMQNKFIKNLEATINHCLTTNYQVFLLAAKLSRQQLLAETHIGLQSCILDESFRLCLPFCYLK